MKIVGPESDKPVGIIHDENLILNENKRTASIPVSSLLFLLFTNPC